MFRLRKIAIIKLYITENVKRGLHSCSHKFCNYMYSYSYVIILHFFHIQPDDGYFTYSKHVAAFMFKVYPITGHEGPEVE